ncbi:MAG: DUF4976 domain-containing protein, partial [Lentisphaerae bacterium]
TFTHAITSNPVCCPTRATIATGLTTRGHGVLENGYQLDPRLPTFMRALQKAGYRTGAFGKLHFRPHYSGLFHDYREYGFDETHITEDPRGGEWLDWVEREHPEYFEAALATIWASQIPDFAEYGPERRDLRSRIQEIRRNFRWATEMFPQNTPRAYTLPFPKEVSQTEWITRHSLDFLQRQDGNQPFFVQISYVQPHGPYCPPGDCMDKVDLSKIPPFAPAEWLTDPHAPGYFKGETPRPRDDYARHCYFADLVHLDEQLGRVINQLETKGVLDSTFIIFTSDHGDNLGDHGFYGKEERHYDACIRVPCIIAGPGLKQGQVADTIIQHEDLCPTFLDIAGTTFPPIPHMGPHLKDKQIPQLPGHSLLPICRGDKTELRDAAYSESYNGIWSIDPGDWVRTIRTRRYRYTLYWNNGEQLFDLKADPDEQRNLVKDPDYVTIRNDLRDRLMNLIIAQDWPKTRRELFALGVH